MSAPKRVTKKYAHLWRDDLAARFAVDIRREMGGGDPRELRRAVAREAYAMADAMLAARGGAK